MSLEKLLGEKSASMAFDPGGSEQSEALHSTAETESLLESPETLACKAQWHFVQVVTCLNG